MKLNPILAAALLAGALLATKTQATPTTFTGSYSQNFDSALAGSSTTIPPGFTSMVIAGGNSTYTAASPITAAGIASATADTQTLTVWNVPTAVASSGTASFNIGCWDGLTDRALGTDPTGTAANVIQLALTNNTGATLYGVTFSYDCKCMTNGSAGTEESELPGYCFFCSTTGTNSAANWTEVGVAGDVAGATNSSGVPIANGLCLPNFTEATTMSSGPVNITFGTPLTNNGVMYFRWADDNNEASSPDQMLAIDDISIATYTPPGPVVSIASPTSGSTLPGGTINLQASVYDLTASVTNVSYYSGITLLGSATTAPYSYVWANVQGGSYSLTAVAVDNMGLTATSSVVSLSVTNLPVASFTGSYSENFDSDLAGSSTVVPTGFTSMVIAGGNSTYTAASPITAAGIASATADTQTLIVWNVPTAVASSGTQTFNIGCWDGLTDRALGTDPTGTAANVIQLALTNNTGATLYGVTFSYDCKCMTNGNVGTEESELPGYCFFYSTTSTGSAANWTEVGVAGDVAGATNSSGVPIANGLCLPNFTEATTMSSGPVNITFGTPLANNGVVYFRWADDNNEANSPDQMLAIDDISIAALNPSGPVASITSPANNATFTPGSSIAITASASESGGTVTNVAFYAGSTLLANITTAPYNYTWPSVAAGSYVLTAVASDAIGLTATSAVVNVMVGLTPPTVSITSPANGSTVGGGTITLQASTSDTSGTVTNVSYYSGSALLGSATSSPYSFAWANVQGGSYSLTAVAMDNAGLTATSSVASLSVTNPLVALFTGSYAQNFDLALSNSTTLMPAGFEAMYLPGSHFSYTNAPGEMLDSNAIATATVGSGAANVVVWNVGAAVTDESYQLFNIGCWDSLNDRALGTDPTGTAGTVIQLALTNNTGSSLSGVVFSYTEKCLTNGSTSNGSYTDDGTERLELPGYEFFYSIVGDTNATNWYTPSALRLTNWVEGTSTDSGPVTLNFPTPLPNGSVMYFRWADDNCVASSPDQMYGIDNISITAVNPNGPVVTLVTPTNNESFIPGTPVNVYASTSDLGTNITSVGFYFDGVLEYTVNNAPYAFQVPGNYVTNGVSISLFAVATDASGLMATSSVVNVSAAYVPPTVALTNPVTGSSYPAIATIQLGASATSADATVTNVAFYNGASLLANVTSAPFTYTWADVTAGTYNLTALATDTYGLTNLSSVVTITVTNGYGLPAVAITLPTNNANYLPGSNILITANATESGGSITNVEFYANATDLGGVASTPYNLTWPSVAAGSYALTAVASDGSGNATTSPVVNITVSTPHIPPMVSLTSPANGTSFAAPANIVVSATASSSDGSVTNVAFYQGGTLLTNIVTAPYNFTWSNVSAGAYALTAAAADNTGAATTSTVVGVTVTNVVNIAVLQQIKTFFIIPLENHDLVQSSPDSSPEQLEGNPACPYFNSLITPGNSNSVQTAWASHYYSCAINGEHPSEPNYIWSQAGTDFGVRTDNDPGNGNTYTNVQHLSGQMTAAGIPWRSYQEDLEYSSSEEVTASGNGAVNPYNGTTEYDYAVKHNPMAFFTDTQNKNCYPMTNFWSDLTNNNIGRYNWITPDQYNEMHSSLSGGFTYNGTAWTGDQAAIAEGDNALSIIIPKIMASQAYKDHGVIIIWTDETESTDDTNTTLPYVIISSLAKGNAYDSTLAYSHSSDLKTMDEIFGLAFQTNAIPSAEADAQNDGKYNYVNGSSAVINDMSDFFNPPASAPVITVPANITVEATNPAGNVVNFTVTATDATDGTLTPTVTPASGSVFPLGTNTVTATATDSLDLSTTNTFSVIVQDTTPPVITILGANPYTNFQTVPFVDPGATAYDTVSGSVPVTTNGTVNVGTLGTYNVQYTASDAAGNSATNTRVVQVVALSVPTSLGGAPVSGGGAAGPFQLSFSAAMGQPYRILGSDDLTQPMANWTVLASGTVTNNPVTFMDLGAVTNDARYYRVVSP